MPEPGTNLIFFFLTEVSNLPLFSAFRPAGPKEVLVTGTFDNWAKSLPLVKRADNSFELITPITIDKDENILYKVSILDAQLL